MRLRKKLRRASSLRSCTGRCSTLALTLAIDLRSRTFPTVRSKTTSPPPFEACLDTLMAGRHISLSHYCRLTTGHPDRRLDTSRFLHSVFGYRTSRPASGYTFYCLHTAFDYLLSHYHTGRTRFTEEHSKAFGQSRYDTTLGGNSSWKNKARRLLLFVFLSLSFLRLLLRSTTLPSHISRAASWLVAFAALRLSDANGVACSSSSPLSPRPLDVKGAIINRETNDGEEKID